MQSYDVVWPSISFSCCPDTLLVKLSANYVLIEWFAGWPKGHNFQFFGLEIDDIFLINWFGGPKPLTVEQYLQVDM